MCVWVYDKNFNGLQLKAGANAAPPPPLASVPCSLKNSLNCDLAVSYRIFFWGRGLARLLELSIVYSKLRFYLIVLSPHSTDIPMKECVAYEGVEVHSGMEGGIYEDPQ